MVIIIPEKRISRQILNSLNSLTSIEEFGDTL